MSRPHRRTVGAPWRAVLLLLVALGTLALAAPPARALEPRVQDPSVEELAERLAEEGDLVAPQVFYDLASIGTQPALDALVGGLELLTDAVRREYLLDACAIFAWGRAAEPARAFLTETARTAKRPNDRLAATRALCAYDPAGRDALLELARTSEDEAVRRAAADGLAPYLLRGRSVEHLDLVLDLALVQAEPQTERRYIGIPRREREAFEKLSHRDVLARCAEQIPTGESLDHVLRRLAEGRVSQVWKRVLVEALGDRSEPIVVDTLVVLLRDPDPRLVLNCLDKLLTHRDAGKWDTFDEDLKPLPSAKDEAVRRAAVYAIGRFGASDPRWRDEVMEMSTDRDRATRQGAARALAELRSPPAIERLFELFTGDDSWTVRYEALKAIEQLRLPESLPVLIGRIEEETLRMRKEIDFTLRMLTGLGIDESQWDRWWDDHGESFELPTHEEAVAAENERRASREGASQTVAGFFDMRIVSDRVIFICDMSSSMEEPAGEVPESARSLVRAGRDAMSRFELAKVQLLQVLQKIPDDTLFNVYFFSHQLEPFDRDMVRMKSRTRGKALRWVREQFPNGSTNVWDALVTAYLEPSVDTIYLLTDGHPTDGEITDPSEIRERVRHWNRVRHVRIHSISLGRYSPLLEGLAQDSGGTYREYR